MHWLYFFALSAFVYWIVFRDGAEVLEGWLAAIVVDLFAGALTAKYLKAYAGIVWLVSLVSLVSGQVTGQSG